MSDTPPVDPPHLLSALGREERCCAHRGMGSDGGALSPQGRWGEGGGEDQAAQEELQVVQPRDYNTDLRRLVLALQKVFVCGRGPSKSTSEACKRRGLNGLRGHENEPNDIST